MIQRLLVNFCANMALIFSSLRDRFAAGLDDIPEESCEAELEQRSPANDSGSPENKPLLELRIFVEDDEVVNNEIEPPDAS